MITETLQSVEVPLKKLMTWNDNVRITGTAEGIPELAASIASVGLLQSLLISKGERGKFAVVAGRRRLLALSHLASTGALKPTWLVPCRIAVDGADLTEMGLTENVMRLPMHPADEFLAFQKLIADGKCVADVAAHFGVSETVVNRRLALARVSPVLLQHYRDQLLSLELLQAFTLTDDHAAQEAVWEGLQPWQRQPHTIRGMLSRNTIPATDKQVRFVGLAQYEAQGGTLRSDLFADGNEGVQILDPAKLTQLVGEKLQTLADEVKAEGWKWVAIQPDIDPQFTGKLRRLPPQPIPLPAKQEAALQKLSEKREALEQQLSEDDDPANETIYERIDKLIEAEQAIEQSRKQVFPEETKARCGVVVSIASNGEPAYLAGLIRKEDERELLNASSPNHNGNTVTATDDASATEEGGPIAYSAALMESLTTYKTAAIAVELSRKPLIALAALVHALVLRTFRFDLEMYRTQTSLQIATSTPSLEAVKESLAAADLERQRTEWLALFPRTETELWQWCLTQNQETLLQLLAFLTATSLNAVQSVHTTSSEGDPKARIQHANAIAGALQMDITRWFEPTAENFFSRVSKAQTVSALNEAGKAIPDPKLKKAELAAVAEQELRGTGWIPAPVRILA